MSILEIEPTPKESAVEPDEERRYSIMELRSIGKGT